METKTAYRVISFEGKSATDLENQVNTFLRDEADITAINISHHVLGTNKEGSESLLYTGVLLYSFPDL